MVAAVKDKRIYELYNLQVTRIKYGERSKRAVTVAFPGDQFGVTTYAEHNIKLKPNSNTIYINAYKLPHSHRETVQKFVTEMLEQGVLQESHSPWNSPHFLVPKKDGTFRPVIDFRHVNEVTEDNHYPLPVL